MGVSIFSDAFNRIKFSLVSISRALYRDIFTSGTLKRRKDSRPSVAVGIEFLIRPGMPLARSRPAARNACKINKLNWFLLRSVRGSKANAATQTFHLSHCPPVYTQTCRFYSQNKLLLQPLYI